MEHNVILPAEWYPQSAVQLRGRMRIRIGPDIGRGDSLLRGYRQGSDQAREVIDCLSGRDRRT